MEDHSADTFDALAGRYDRLHFLQRSAERLVELAGLRPGARVLDVATGTGTVALAAARQLGPGAEVTGLDLSPGMLAQARQKAPVQGAHLSFVEGDAARLPFEDTSFDALLCASALFFLPDMPAALREWRRVLAPGGTLGFSSFGAGLLRPLGGLWAECLTRHGLVPWRPSFARLQDPATCRALLTDAGLVGVRVAEKQLGYHLSPEARWRDIEAGLEAGSLQALSPEERASIRDEHLAELRAQAGPEGLWLDVPVLFTLGRAPG